MLDICNNATGVGRRICDEIRASNLFTAFAEHYGFDYSFCNLSAPAGESSAEHDRKLFGDCQQSCSRGTSGL